MAFRLQDSFDMMNANESVKLLFMIPVLLYKTSTDEISFPPIWTYYKNRFFKFILKCPREGQNANSNKCSHNIIL